MAVGRLIEKKGFTDLICACEVVRKRGREFRCRIIGEGPLEEPLRAQIDAGGWQGQVEVAGPRPQSEVRAGLAGATLFVLPCIAEPSGAMDNLPTVIMEAMAAGVPVVSTQIGGIPEMVVENETGLLVSPNDPSALAGAIEKLLFDPALAKKFGQAGWERACALFSIEKNVRDLLRLFL
jgi:glycosyltransferase involved in cell wall biosynthesis